MSDGKGGAVGGGSHVHVLVRVCRRINAPMNLSVRACACPFLTGSLLHFKIGVANDPWLTRSPAERGRVGEGRPSLRARQYRTESLTVRAYLCQVRMSVRVGVSSVLIQCVSMNPLIYACAHVHKEARRVSD